eukprot:TRINITY_DN110_c0_g1_i1.p1 TRINITY_DN110_c0_g1~~TRINITY_DN110_c0_g1_i1.p1  ORF type:complete len:214 (+),score=81.31 TRINITY_DN110_c0_g1_i1:70-642(+)
MPARRKEPLMRDLYTAAETVEGKIIAGKLGLDNVMGLKDKMERVAGLIEEAEKERSERVGQVEKDIAEHELKAVTAALMKHKKVCVDAFEVKELRRLERGGVEDQAKKRQKLDTEVAKRVQEEVRFKELQFAEKFAETLAKESAFQVERKTLAESIEALRLEIESQKKLTGDIAKAAVQHPIVQQVSKTQ